MLRINLLPPELRKRKKVQIFDRALIYGIIAIIAEILLLYMVTLSQQAKINEIEGEIGFVQVELAKYKDKIALIDEIEKIKVELKTRMEAVQELENKRAFWVKILSNYAQLIPDFLWVNNITKKGDSGLESKGNSYNLRSIAIFLSNLINSELFQDVSVGAINKGKGNTYSFTVNMTISSEFLTEDLGNFEVDSAVVEEKKEIKGGFVESTREKMGLVSREETKIMFQ